MEVKTHSEESQQQLNAFTVQPKEDKRRGNGLLSACSIVSWACGAHGRKEMDSHLCNVLQDFLPVMFPPKIYTSNER